MDKVETNTKVLIGRQEIMDWLKISKHAFGQFIQMGMPALILNGRYYAHKDNLDDFFREITRVKNTPLERG